LTYLVTLPGCTIAGLIAEISEHFLRLLLITMRLL